MCSDVGKNSGTIILTTSPKKKEKKKVELKVKNG